MTSAERIRAVVRHEAADHVPLAFEGLLHGGVRFLRDRFPDPRARADYYLSLGVDTAISFSPDPVDLSSVVIRDWTDHPVGEPYPILHRAYSTPAGELRQSVRQTDDYLIGAFGPHGGPPHVRLISDHNVPASRSVEYLVSRPEHLPALAHLLRPIGGAAREAYLRQAAEMKAACRERGILFAGYSLGVGDPLMWFSGVENVLLWAMDDPGFLRDYTAIVARWNRENLALMAEAGCEYVVRRGWYETADFWSPDLFDRFLLPHLQAETAFARSAGMIYAYCMNSGIDPLLDSLVCSGIDVLCNLDAMAPRTTPSLLRGRLGGRIVLCGGVNNQHVIAAGSRDDVRRAVNFAFNEFAIAGPFILAPGDSLLEPTAKTEENFHVMVAAWQERVGA